MKTRKATIKKDMNGKNFCTGCGKADFRTIHHAYGHTGVCRGLSEITEALAPTLGPSSPSPSLPPSLGGVVPPMSVALAGAVGSETENLHRVQISMLEEKIERLEKLTTNHIPHLSGQMDGITDFFQSTTFKWGMAIVAVIAILYIIDKGDSKTKTSVGNKLIDLAMKKL